MIDKETLLSLYLLKDSLITISQKNIISTNTSSDI